jgi:hypothetical protein
MNSGASGIMNSKNLKSIRIFEYEQWASGIMNSKNLKSMRFFEYQKPRHLASRN